MEIMDNNKNDNQRVKCKFYEDLIRNKGLVELAKEFEEKERKNKDGEQQREHKLLTVYEIAMKRYGKNEAVEAEEDA